MDKSTYVSLTQQAMKKYLAEHPLCYADYLSLNRSKIGEKIFVSRIYGQKMDQYEQKFDVPTFEFSYKKDLSNIADQFDLSGYTTVYEVKPVIAMQFSRVKMYVPPAFTTAIGIKEAANFLNEANPTRITDSTALASATEQRKQSEEYDCLTSYCILKALEESGEFSTGYAKKTITEKFTQLRELAETSPFDLGKYLVYLYTTCLVFNIAFGAVRVCKTEADMWTAVRLVEPKVLKRIKLLE